MVINYKYGIYIVYSVLHVVNYRLHTACHSEGIHWVNVHSVTAEAIKCYAASLSLTQSPL